MFPSTLDAPFASEEVENEVNQLVKTLQTYSTLATDVVRFNLHQLWSLSNKDENKLPLCNRSLGLLELLKDILHSETNPQVLRPATGILWFLSRDNRCKIILGSPQTEIIPATLRLVQTPSLYQSNIISMISNLVLEKNCHDYLVTPEFEFFEMLDRELLTRPDAYQTYKCISSFTQVARNENVLPLIALGIHRKILRKLTTSSLDPQQWVAGGNGPTGWALSFAASFSSLPAGSQAIREFGCKEFFIQLMSLASIEGIQATIVVANSFITPETTDDTETVIHRILSHHSSILELMIDLLDITIEYHRSREVVKKYRRWNYGYGIVQLRDITSALKNLAMNRENLAIMIQSSRILPLVRVALEAFIENREEFQGEENYSLFHAVEKGGGGGRDCETASNVLELLMQLVFAVGEDQIEREIFFRVSKHFVAIHILLVSLLQIPTNSPDRVVPERIYVLGNILLKILSNEDSR